MLRFEKGHCRCDVLGESVVGGRDTGEGRAEVSTGPSAGRSDLGYGVVATGDGHGLAVLDRIEHNLLLEERERAGALSGKAGSRRSGGAGP